MTRRDFRTPPSLPEETQTRCITIPASQPWLGLVNAALLMLTEEWRYDQVDDTDMTPTATAARAMQMYVEYLGVCEMACCPMRINPFNGRLQQSPDDGLTWFDVEDGPWTESLYPEFSAMPEPRPEVTEDGKKCAAAATAAYVLRNLYDQTGNTLLNVVAATDWEYAGALGAMLQGFLMMIGAAAVQPFVAIASLLGIVGVKQQYVDYPLDSADEERITCILLENATVQPSGAVTFAFQAVWDAIDLDSPKNGLVRFLLTMIGPDALNYAGAIDAGITPNCEECGTWCYTIDFEDSDGGFAATSFDNANTFGNYISGTGWSYSSALSSTGNYSRAVLIERTFATPVEVTSVEYTFTRAGVYYYANVRWWSISYDDDDQILAQQATDRESGTITRDWIGSQTIDSLILMARSDYNDTPTYGGSVVIKSVTVRGIGENPFGEDNC